MILRPNNDIQTQQVPPRSSGGHPPYHDPEGNAWRHVDLPIHHCQEPDDPLLCPAKTLAEYLRLIKSHRRTVLYGEEWEVEMIKGYKKVGKTMKWGVKWKGFPDKDCTWEPLENLQNAQDALADFHARCITIDSETD